MPDHRPRTTAQELIALVTGEEFSRLNARVSNHDRVVMARVLARDCELRGVEIDALEAWAEDFLSAPTVSVVLTEKERARLRQRFVETFAGDRGIGLGFTSDDRALAARLGVDVRAPDEERELDARHALAGLDLGFRGIALPVPSEGEVLAEWARARNEARGLVEEVRTQLRNLVQHLRHEREPTVAAGLVELRVALEAMERGYAHLDRPDLEARGLDPRTLDEALRTHIEAYRAQLLARSLEVRSQPSDDAMKQRYRLRRAAARDHTTVPPAGRDAMEPKPETPDERERWSRIEAAARTLAEHLTGGLPPLGHAGLGEVLLHVEREVLSAHWADRTAVLDAFDVPEVVRSSARTLLSAIRGPRFVVPEPDRMVFRGIVRWITNQAVCFRCRHLGRDCKCLEEHAPAPS